MLGKADTVERKGVLFNAVAVAVGDSRAAQAQHCVFMNTLETMGRCNRIPAFHICVSEFLLSS